MTLGSEMEEYDRIEFMTGVKMSDQYEPRKLSIYSSHSQDESEKSSIIDNSILTS